MLGITNGCRESTHNNKEMHIQDQQNYDYNIYANPVKSQIAKSNYNPANE